MSTYLYLECLDHNPPLRADEESGQHLYDLPQIRQDIANRDMFCEIAAFGECPDWGHHFRNNTIRFLVCHPKCRIGIRDEYGREHSTDDQERLLTAAGFLQHVVHKPREDVYRLRGFTHQLSAGDSCVACGDDAVTISVDQPDESTEWWCARCIEEKQ